MPLPPPVASNGSAANMSPPAPSARKLVAIALILLLIVVWAVLVASLAQFVEHWPVLVQALFYLVMGLAWIVPLRPLIRWSQTGHWGANSS
ncbi:MAG TPA: DUF2842 domain-containing protein [Sphingomicrobium sp.]|nr:DUF2842 domain-containing protein [Sphingomicrobium sp.]